MKHEKMNYTYIGIDSHKSTHTAVFIDFFFEKLGDLTFTNLPSKFDDFLKEAEKFKMDGTTLLFGMEDVSAYGRSLAVFLTEKGYQVKHVNAALVVKERKNRNVVEKTDSIDAECVARVLLSRFAELPDAHLDDKYHALRTIVVRRSFVVKDYSRLKSHLHTLLRAHYPNYNDFFRAIDCKTSLAFFKHFPSPHTLSGVSPEELATFLKEPSRGQIGVGKANTILSTLEKTTIEHQEIRDIAVQSTIRQLEFIILELEQLEESMAEFLKHFNCTLMSMSGIDIVTAAQMLSCIGDIKKFSSSAKLARYAGIAPVTYSSGKRDIRYATQKGNRELHTIFFTLSVRLIATKGSNSEIFNPFFYDYYHRKLKEGKTKRQALKCVERRLVNIIWTMLTYGEEYVNPPRYDAPKKDAKTT